MEEGAVGHIRDDVGGGRNVDQVWPHGQQASDGGLVGGVHRRVGRQGGEGDGRGRHRRRPLDPAHLDTL